MIDYDHKNRGILIIKGDVIVSIREKGIYGSLVKYCNKRGLFEFTWTNIGICTHPYIMNTTEKPNSYLVQNVYDVLENKMIAEFMWVNINKSLLDLEAQAGDRIQANYYAEKYRLGKEYHPLNTIRRPNKLYRLKWPTNMHIIGHEDIIDPLYKPVADLQTGISYKSFYEYTYKTDFCRGPVAKDLLLIQLIDSLNYVPIWLKLSTMKFKRIQPIKPVHQPRRGIKLPKDWKKYKKVCKLRDWNLYKHDKIRPNVMFLDTYNKLTKEQQKVLLNRVDPL